MCAVDRRISSRVCFWIMKRGAEDRAMAKNLVNGRTLVAESSEGRSPRVVILSHVAQVSGITSRINQPVATLRHAQRGVVFMLSSSTNDLSQQVKLSELPGQVRFLLLLRDCEASNSQHRNKKCDQSRPTCRRCHRAGVECEGYPASKHLGRNVSSSATNLTRTLSSSFTTGPSVQLSNLQMTPTNASAPPPHPRVPGADPSSQLVTPIFSPNQFQFRGIAGDINTTTTLDRTHHVPHSLNLSEIDSAFIGSSTIPADRSRAIPSQQERIRQAPIPPHEESKVSNSNAPLHMLPTPPWGRNLRPMTAGQASLFDALLSLGKLEDEYQGFPNTTLPTPPYHAETLLSPQSEADGANWAIVNYDNVDDSEDTEDVIGAIGSTLALDRHVQSNSVPYILQSCAWWFIPLNLQVFSYHVPTDALWVKRFLFEPLRVAQIAKDYVSFRYQISPESRRKMMLISDIVRTVARSTAFDMGSLPNLASLVEQMNRGFALASSRRESSRELDIEGALRALDNSYEVRPCTLVFARAHVVRTS
jgi:hypothetical protein